jgi:hypothetical protein
MVSVAKRPFLKRLSRLGGGPERFLEVIEVVHDLASRRRLNKREPGRLRKSAIPPQNPNRPRCRIDGQDQRMILVPQPDPGCPLNPAIPEQMNKPIVLVGDPQVSGRVLRDRVHWPARHVFYSNESAVLEVTELLKR